MAFRIFIGSSMKAERYVQALQINLEKASIGSARIEAIPWKFAFELGGVTLDSLMDRAEECDAAVFIFAHDDFVTPNFDAKNQPIPTAQQPKGFFATRDNVILELGLFTGRLGRDRVFFALPKDHDNLHLPSDLKGITWAEYNDNRSAGEEEMAMVECCHAVVKALCRSRSLPPRPKLLDIFNKLQLDIANVVDTIQTRPVGRFPAYFKTHICRLVSEAKELWIASDVLTYAAFTDPENSAAYMRMLMEKSREVKVLIPAKARMEASLRRQIPPDVWAENYRSDKLFQGKLALFEEFAGTENIDTPEKFYAAVLQLQEKKRKYIKRVKPNVEHGLTVAEVDVDLPIFLWIADDREAFFSIPMDRTTSSVFEHGFVTKDKDLILGLRATWERYAATAV